jgi:hypothetical protein
VNGPEKATHDWLGLRHSTAHITRKSPQAKESKSREPHTARNTENDNDNHQANLQRGPRLRTAPCLLTRLVFAVVFAILGIHIRIGQTLRRYTVSAHQMAAIGAKNTEVALITAVQAYVWPFARMATALAGTNLRSRPQHHHSASICSCSASSPNNPHVIAGQAIQAVGKSLGQNPQPRHSWAQPRKRSLPRAGRYSVLASRGSNSC